ncbi:HEAT repeat domain-containing protein [Treponema sp. OMZ 787]|uniref:sister chromatid cohesion protein PDS5 n=1 Tax=Treponema sp. OMZ 787 TaxID=2563669 RepID=UPI0020A585A2|nr:sister chromatid cohesion protein PDS5 [Treponema sp. OMZ 787]UTC61465.1 HEAT repeat domain-containing protein [Treponema sp. OMZ 787]
MPAAALTRLKEISRRPKESLEAISTNDIAFIQDCLTSADDEIVAYAYWTIGQIGIVNPNAVASLINQAFADLQSASEKVRENALFAIGRTGRAKIDVVANRIDEILSLHTDTAPRVRMSMIWACENIANTDAELFKNHIEVFEKLLDDPDEKYVRPEAPEIFRVIGKYKPEIVAQSLAKLKEKLNDICKTMRIHSAGAIRIIEKNLTF